MNDARQDFARTWNVSRETLEAFDRFHDLLLKWQRTINLVGPRTLADVWSRHFADSAQVLAACPHALRWVDLGSGAGFPGLVIALLLKQKPGAHVVLVEVDQRKCAFLREVIRATGAPASVCNAKLEDVVADLDAEAVTSRALAPLPELVTWSLPLLKKGAFGVFPKGRDVMSELTGMAAISNIKAELKDSRTDPESRLVLVRYESWISRPS